MTPRDLDSAPLSARVRSARKRVAAFAAAAFAIVGLADPAAADDVFLVNGEVFEGVVAVVSETHVLVDLPIGRLRFARSQVDRVVSAASPLAILRERRAELLDSSAASADDWLELAQWARLAGLDEDARQIALVLAQRSPLLDGLGPVMRGYGFVLDEADGWVPKAEAMRRQGYVLDDGEWVTQEQRQARVAEREVRARERNEQFKLEQEREAEALTRRASDNDVALEAVRLARAVVDQRDNRRGTEVGSGGFYAVGGPVILPGLPLSGSFPMVVGPGAIVGDGSGNAVGAPALRSSVQIDWEALANRQPGSIIPISSHRQQVVAGRRSP